MQTDGLEEEEERGRGLNEDQWSLLLGAISDGTCTPFIGAGASVGSVPRAGELAGQWAERFQYPLTDRSNLARVAQFLSIDKYEVFPKREMEKVIRQAKEPAYPSGDEPHGALARLRLPVYVTTNYDDFMFEALDRLGRRPRREFCRWNEITNRIHPASAFDDGYKPTEAEPLVFHLHGHHEVLQSMVLTEDDYLDFLIRFAEDTTLLPPPVQQAFAGNALLFVGYGLADWTFRVLIRGLMKSMSGGSRFPAVAIQVTPEDAADASRRREAEAYLKKYFSAIQRQDIWVYWGKPRQFAVDLRKRMECFRDAG
jgi:SIR2-like domain